MQSMFISIHIKQLLSALLGVALLTSPLKIKEKEMSVYDFQIQSIDGNMVDFSAYKGKPILVVNTASECGYTPQYADLQEVHQLMGDRLTILGFPANNFGGQEPGANKDIAAFCKKNYGVTFTLFSKMEVVGKNQHPLFKYLEEETGKAPSWNFCKYLISTDGKEISFYPSNVNPAEIAEKL